MADPQVTAYVQSSLAQGVPVPEIRSALLSQGWPQAQVDEALAAAAQGAGQQDAGGDRKAGMSFLEAVVSVLRASEKHYSELYLYKVLLQACVFSAASLVLIFFGLPWFIPAASVACIMATAYLEISRAKKATARTLQ